MCLIFTFLLVPALLRQASQAIDTNRGPSFSSSVTLPLPFSEEFVSLALAVV